MAVWIMRTGKGGESEATDLREGLIAYTWKEIPDLRTLPTREDIKAAIEDDRTRRRWGRAGAIPIHAGQLLAFRDAITVGDLVLLPLRSDPEVIAVGDVVGEYEYRPEFWDVESVHTRAVRWQRRLRRRDLDPDLREALRARRTLQEIHIPDAEPRLRTLLR